MPVPPLAKALREARVSCGLTQAEAGALVGYSASAISRLERGGAVEVNTALRLADCYGVDLRELGFGRGWDSPEQGRTDLPRRQLLAMAGLTVPLWALTKLDDALAMLPEPSGNVSAGTVATKLATGRTLYDNDHHTRLVAALPALLAAAHRQADTTRAPCDWAALASAYELATHVMSKLGRHGSSRLTADRALTYARLSESPVSVALSTRALSIVLRHEDRSHLAEGVNLDAITTIEKTGLGTPDERTVFVQMLCSTAYAAARSGDADRARELTAEADRALHLLPDRPAHPASPVNATVLTPAQVRLYKVSMFCALGDSASALTAARGLQLAQFPTAERRGRLLTDIARAWWLHGRAEPTARALVAAHRHAPGEVIDRPGVRELAAELVDHHPQLSEARTLRAILRNARAI